MWGEAGDQRYLVLHTSPLHGRVWWGCGRAMQLLHSSVNSCVSCFRSTCFVVCNQWWCNDVTRCIPNVVSQAKTKCIALQKLVCMHVEQQACLWAKCVQELATSINPEAVHSLWHSLELANRALHFAIQPLHWCLMIVSICVSSVTSS